MAKINNINGIIKIYNLINLNKNNKIVNHNGKHYLKLSTKGYYEINNFFIYHCIKFNDFIKFVENDICYMSSSVLCDDDINEVLEVYNTYMF